MLRSQDRGFRNSARSQQLIMLYRFGEGADCREMGTRASSQRDFQPKKIILSWRDHRRKSMAYSVNGISKHKEITPPPLKHEEHNLNISLYLSSLCNSYEYVIQYVFSGE